MTLLRNAVSAIFSTRTDRPYPVMLFILANLVMTLAGREHRALALSALAVSFFFALVSVRYYVVRYREKRNSSKAV